MAEKRNFPAVVHLDRAQFVSVKPNQNPIVRAYLKNRLQFGLREGSAQGNQGGRAGARGELEEGTRGAGLTQTFENTRLNDTRKGARLGETE